MSTPEPTPVRELRDVSAEQFRAEILPALQPVVLRGLVADWPAVRAGRESPQAMANYLRGFDTGASADTMFGDPAIGGRFFYNDDLTGHNFQRRPQRIVAFAGAPAGAARPSRTPRRCTSAPCRPRPACPASRATTRCHWSMPPPCRACGSATASPCRPITTSRSNIACVVAGRRRFTLFPPEQLVNLYVGPLEFTLAGQPISMARLDQPDFERFPRFRDALASAQCADLEPGDALFVPYMWWHHVESRERFNVLVNYWWDDTPAWQGSPFEALLHGIMVDEVAAAGQARNLAQGVRSLHVPGRRRSGGASHAAPAGIQGPPSPQLAETHPRAADARAVAPPLVDCRRN